MNVLCVVVVLSLIPVCQPASLACDLLLKPMEEGPDVTGRWHVIALSSNYCWVTALLNSLFLPSIQVDVTSTEKPHYYDANIRLKMYGACDNKTFRYYKTNMIAEVNQLDGMIPTGSSDLSTEIQSDQKAVFLHSRCRDCLVIRDNAFISFLVILSRRPNMTAAELKEFEVLADCLSLYKPQVLNMDHDYDNCTSPENIDPYSAEVPDISGRVGSLFSKLFTCTTDKLLYYPRVAFRWAQQTWADLW